MKFTITPSILIALIAFGISSCQIGDCVTGKGEVKSMELNVADFERFKSNGSIDVILRSGPKNVTVRGYENVIDSVYGIVENNTLTIEKKQGCYLNSELEVVVTVPGLRSIDLNGSGDLKVESVSSDGSLILESKGSGDIELYDLININNLKVSLSGSGDITSDATNKMDILNVSIQGSGDFEAERVQFKSAIVRMSGSGDTDIWVTDSVDAQLSGSGDLNVKGDSTIKQKTSGSGEVIVEN